MEATVQSDPAISTMRELAQREARRGTGKLRRSRSRALT